MKKIKKNLIGGKQIKDTLISRDRLYILFYDGSIIIFESITFPNSSGDDYVSRIEIDASNLDKTDYALVLLGAITQKQYDFEVAKQKRIREEKQRAEHEERESKRKDFNEYLQVNKTKK